MSDNLSFGSMFHTCQGQFKIPSYQRPYSWEEPQISQFLEDLRDATNHYYLGHFLFEKDDASNKDYLIIDGQQRITTCVIFFSSMHDELLKRKNLGEMVEYDVDGIKDEYLRNIRKGTQKLVTVEDDNNFFIDEIIERNNPDEPTSQSQRRIREAKNLFDKACKNTETTELIRWCKLIEEASVTDFFVKDKIQAAEIFAFQNDRGKALSKIEVLKAFFMLQIYLYADNNEIASECIKYIEKDISKIYSKTVRIRQQEDDVLNYYWRSRKGYYTEEVVAEVKKCLSKENDKIAWIKEFVSGLRMAFDSVMKVEENDYSYIKDLRYLNNLALAYPFFIKADRIKVSVGTFERMSRFLENITFRSLLRGGRADVESRLNPFLKDFKNEEELLNNINQMIDRIKTDWWWSYWNDEEMKRVINGWMYQNRVDNYLLWKYELYISNENHPMPTKVSFEDLIRNESIEHIAPRTETNGDPIANGYGAYEGADGIAEGGWLNAIGNLMLIAGSHNSSIGNKPFAEKLASYGVANLLNQQKEIASFVNENNPVWDTEAIKKRQKKITDAANEIWSLDKI